MSAVGLVLFSHGSLLCGSGGILKQHAEKLRASGRYVAVEPGYLNYCSPPVEDAIAACLRAGAEEIVIVPYFLIAGKFVKVDLPRRLDAVRQQFPDTPFKIARAMEDLPVMHEAVEQLVAGAHSPRKWQEQAIADARLHCELRSDCPLYGTPACRSSDKVES